MARSFHRPGRMPGISLPRKPQPEIASFIDTSLVKPRAGMKRDEAITQMASDMREAMYREGGLTEQGLQLLGFSDEQIATLVKPARELANTLAGAA